MPNLDLGTLKTTVVVDAANAKAAINDINNAQSTLGENAKRVGGQIDAAQKQMTNGWADVRGQLELTKDLYEKVSKPVLDLLKSCTQLADTNGELADAQEALNEQLDTLKASLGEVLAPLIETILDTLTGLVGYINDMPQGVKAISTAVLVAVGAFGLLAPTIQKVTAAIKALEAGTTVGRVMLIASAIASATAALAVMLTQADNTADKFTETKNHFNDLIKDVEKDKAKTVNIDIKAEMKDNVKTQLSLAVNDVNTILSEIETEKYTDVQLSVDGWENGIDPQTYIDNLDDLLIDAKAVLNKYNNGEYVAQDELDAAKAALNNAISFLEVTNVDCSTEAGQQLYNNLRGKYLAAIALYGAFQQPINVVTDDENLEAEKGKITNMFGAIDSVIDASLTLNATNSLVEFSNEIGKLFGSGEGSLKQQIDNLQENLNDLADIESITAINDLFNAVTSSVTSWSDALANLKQGLSDAIKDQSELNQRIIWNAGMQVYYNEQNGLITHEQAVAQYAVLEQQLKTEHDNTQAAQDALNEYFEGEITLMDAIYKIGEVAGIQGQSNTIKTDEEGTAAFFKFAADGNTAAAMSYLPQVIGLSNRLLEQTEELGVSGFLDEYTERANTPAGKYIAGAGYISYYDPDEFIEPFIKDINDHLATRPLITLLDENGKPIIEKDENGNEIEKQVPAETQLVYDQLVTLKELYETATEEQKAELEIAIANNTALLESLKDYDYWEGIMDILNGKETDLALAVAEVMAEQGLTFDSKNTFDFLGGAASYYLDSLADRMATIETGASQSGDVYNDEVHNGDNITNNNVTINNNYSHGQKPMNANRESQEIINALKDAN